MAELRIDNTVSAEVYGIAMDKKAEKPAEQAPVSPDAVYDRYTAESSDGASIKQIAKSICAQYSWIKFSFADIGDSAEDIAKFAVQAGKGTHVVISTDVLEWMSQGDEAMKQGYEMISKMIGQMVLQSPVNAYNKGIIIGENGEATVWATQWSGEKPDSMKTEWEQEAEQVRKSLEKLEEARKEQAARQKKLLMCKKKKINYQMGRDMSRLARGATDRDVRSLIHRMYAQRGSIAANSKYDKKEKQYALAQIDHVIRCAQAKIRHLKEEGQMEARRKKAEKAKKEKLSKQLEKELKDRRRARKAREHARIFERLPDLPGLRDEHERREAWEEALAAMEAAGLTGAAPEGMSPAAGGTSGAGMESVGFADSTVVNVSTPMGGNVQVTVGTLA